MEWYLSIFKKEKNELIVHIILAGISASQNRLNLEELSFRKKDLVMKKICFEKYKADKIWLDVYSDNKKVIGLYESQSFLKEKTTQNKEDSNPRYLWIMSTNNI